MLLAPWGKVKHFPFQYLWLSCSTGRSLASIILNVSTHLLNCKMSKKLFHKYWPLPPWEANPPTQLPHLCVFLLVLLGENVHICNTHTLTATHWVLANMPTVEIMSHCDAGHSRTSSLLLFNQSKYFSDGLHQRLSSPVLDLVSGDPAGCCPMCLLLLCTLVRAVRSDPVAVLCLDGWATFHCVIIMPSIFPPLVGIG